MTALLTRQGFEVDAVDMFCGFGGSSQGIHKAGASVRVAVNHSELSLECHAANYPHVDHRQADLSNETNPEVVNRVGKKVAGTYIDPASLPPARFLWASPSCKNHSLANAKRIYAQGPQAVLFEDEFDHVAYANSERSRVTMMCPLRYAAKHRPEIVVIENVVEAAHWGPAIRPGSKKGDGTTFAWWLREWENHGYEWEALFLNSMFFPPCPQSRDRMYVVFWRRGNKRPDLDYRPTACCVSDRCSGAIVQAVQTWRHRTSTWPPALDRWGKYGVQYDYRCPNCKARVEPVAWPAYTAIDWTNLGPTLGDRVDAGKDLAPATIERIRRGLTKFRNGPPVVIPAKAIYGVDRPVTDPLTTLTTQREKGLAHIGDSFLVKNNGKIDEASYRAVPMSGPLGSVTASPTQAMVMANRTNNVPRHVGEPLHPLTTVAVHGLVVNPAQAGTDIRHAANRSRRGHEQLFSLTATGGQALAAIPFDHLPFSVDLRGGGSHQAGQHPVIDHLSTLTAAGKHLSLASMFTKINGGPGDTAWHDPTENPFGTITPRDTTGLVVLPWLEPWISNPTAITEAMAALTTRLRMSIAAAPVETGTITDDDLMAVHFRMLEADPEYRRGMAFADDYVLIGSKTQRAAGLGNAVTPPVADWVTGQCLATLEGAAA